MKTQTYEEQAREIGTEHGRNAASWVELDEATAEAIDQAQNVYDVLEPSSPLSGEWADGYSYDDLASDVGYQTHDDDGVPLQDAGSDLVLDDIMSAYEEGYWDAFSAEVERKVETLRGPTLDLRHGAYKVEGHEGIAWTYEGQTFGGLAQMIMVGDDRVFTFDPEDLTPLDDLDYCVECGQVGCTGDFRDRSES